MESDIRVGGAQIRLQQIRLREDITLDEVQLDTKEVRFETFAAGATIQNGASVGAGYLITVAETDFSAMMAEPNLNRMLTTNLPADVPIRNIQLALLSGKVRITGQFVKSVLSLPFTVEAVPMLDNGVRIWFDFQSAKLGFKIPGAVLDVLEQFVGPSLSLDLSKLPFPVRLDEIRCEPGRLKVKGKARISWPPIQSDLPPAPFTLPTASLPTGEPDSAT